MPRISPTMFENITIHAGSKALEIIQDEGLDMDRVKVLAGASGSAKFLVLTWIDRVVLSLLKDRILPLYLIGTSIGAFRMAAFCQPDPLGALETLEQEYIAQQYSLKPTPNEVTTETRRILDAYIDDDKIEAMLNHPFMRLNFLSNKCKGLLRSDHPFAQWPGLLLAAGVNLLGRRHLKCFLERALFCSPGPRGTLPPFAGMDEFPIHLHDLTPSNFKQALLSSGSIPIAMEGVSDIDGVPGVFRDGGVLDYHLDIPFLPESDQLVLYPHFYDTITPGWFDKNLHRQPDPKNMESLVLVSPSRKFVRDLPTGKIPDRKDFMTYKGNDDQRRAHWRTAIKRSRRLGDEFAEAVESKKIGEIVRPL